MLTCDPATMQGWRLFAEAHRVQPGDQVSFELVTPRRLVVQVISTEDTKQAARGSGSGGANGIQEEPPSPKGLLPEHQLVHAFEPLHGLEQHVSPCFAALEPCVNYMQPELQGIPFEKSIPHSESPVQMSTDAVCLMQQPAWSFAAAAAVAAAHNAAQAEAPVDRREAGGPASLRPTGSGESSSQMDVDRQTDAVPGPSRAGSQLPPTTPANPKPHPSTASLAGFQVRVHIFSASAPGILLSADFGRRPYLDIIPSTEDGYYYLINSRSQKAADPGSCVCSLPHSQFPARLSNTGWVEGTKQ